MGRVPALLMVDALRSRRMSADGRSIAIRGMAIVIDDVNRIRFMELPKMKQCNN